MTQLLYERSMKLGEHQSTTRSVPKAWRHHLALVLPLYRAWLLGFTAPELSEIAFARELQLGVKTSRIGREILSVATVCINSP